MGKVGRTTTHGSMRSVGTPNYTGGNDTTRMRSLSRAISPPNVTLFGGVGPDGEDADEGLVAARSREEEEERIAEREEKGPDPWAVRFEPGEKINPKVRDRSRLAD